MGTTKNLTIWEQWVQTGDRVLEFPYHLDERLSMENVNCCFKHFSKDHLYVMLLIYRLVCTLVSKVCGLLKGRSWSLNTKYQLSFSLCILVCWSLCFNSDIIVHCSSPRGIKFSVTLLCNYPMLSISHYKSTGKHVYYILTLHKTI